MDKKLRITLLLFIDVCFAVLELVTGYAVHSLALVADSFHMFNDILSLLVALWAVQVSKKGHDGTYTYGLERAEILGALINAVFLLALCVTIILEAIQRFIEVPEVSNPKLILVVGFAGLISNIVGLFLFHEHGHSHGGSGHGHSHAGDVEASAEHSHSHGPTNDHSHSDHSSSNCQLHSNFSDLLPESAIAREEQRLLDYAQSYGSISNDPHATHNHSIARKNDSKKQKSMNMEGVFLHVLGDALGNVGVMLTAIFIWKTDYSWRFYADPFISLVITAIIFSSAIPLCLRASRVLLQAAPSTVNADEVRQDLESIPGVADIHDLHIWQLSETQTVATLHVTVELPPSDFHQLARVIQQCFAGHGIPSITIQPEFQEPERQGTETAGLRQCQSNGNLLCL